MELPDRIATIIKVNQHTPATFADVLGVQRSSVSHVLNGRNKPSMDFIQKIIEHFPRVDASWLITGKQAAHLAQADAKAPRESGKDLNLSVHHADGQHSAHIQATRDLSSGKSIEKIVVFYTDRTFDVYEQ